MNTPPGQMGTIANRSMPPGSIIPELVYDDVHSAVTWLCEIFGFTERLRIGEHRSQLVYGGASMIVVGRNRENSSQATGTGVPVLQQGSAAHSIMVRVAAVDPHYEHASQSGARIVSPPADYPFGERQYTVEDLAGHRWTFSQSIADVDPRTWGGTLIANDDPA